VAEADIRAGIVAALSAIPGTGRIHNRERWAATWDKFLALFKDTDSRIRGWSVTRRATPAEEANQRIIREHTYEMQGVLGLNDEEASEIAFQAHIEAIQNVFDRKQSLGATNGVCWPAQVEAVEIRMFGRTLCHYARLTMIVKEKVA
jgi:hypothetical protein